MNKQYMKRRTKKEKVLLNVNGQYNLCDKAMLAL